MHSSDLLPVWWEGRPAMLKVARSVEEERGNALMVWLGGVGAARVYRHAGRALLMERLEGAGLLAALVASGQDDEATRVLCGAAAGVHRPRPEEPGMLPLRAWFRALAGAAGHGGTFADAWAAAQGLLGDQRDVRPLHGDLHHGNVLRSADRGWLVIDPKGLLGERAFDFANMLCNPGLEDALRPGRLERQAGVIARTAGLEAGRLLAWVGAYAGLSAAWHLEDGQPVQAEQTLQVAAAALALSHRSAK